MRQPSGMTDTPAGSGVPRHRQVSERNRVHRPTREDTPTTFCLHLSEDMCAADPRVEDLWMLDLTL